MPLQTHVFGGDLKGKWDAMQGGFEHGVDLSAEDTFKGASHSQVALEAGAAGQYLLVGGGHMRVRPDHSANASIDMSSHQLFVARRFGVKFDHPQSVLWMRLCELGQYTIDGLEGTVDRFHEDSSQDASHRQR